MDSKMAKYSNLWGALALVLALSLWINLPSDLFVGVAYQDYKNLYESGLEFDFEKIENYYNYLTIYQTLIGAVIIFLSFSAVGKQNEIGHSGFSSAAIFLNIITIIMLVINLFYTVLN